MPTRRLASLLTLFALLLLPALAFAWPHPSATNVLVASDAYGPKVVSDGAGGSFVAFYGYRDAVSTYDVFVQRYDAAGNALWGAPVDLCTATALQYPQGIVSDGLGGAVVVWADDRSSGTTGRDLYAQRISGAGVAQWAVNGVPVCVAAGNQDNARVVVAPGYVWIAWSDPRNSATTSNDIYAQRLDMNGAIAFAVNGGPVCTAVDFQSEPDIAPDEFGRAVITWTDNRAGNSDIYAQLYSGGTGSWALNGVGVSTGPGAQGGAFVRMIGTRCIVAWSDQRGADYDIYAQRIDAYNGSAGWTANGIPVCTATGSQYLSDMARDLNGGVVMTWTDSRAGVFQADVYAQKLDQLGTLLWTSSGVAVHVGPGYCNTPRIVADDAGGTILAWVEGRVDLGDVYAQRLSASGSLQWTYTGVPVCTAAGQQYDLVICQGAPGSLIAAWADRRTSPFSVRAQGVDEWGYLGAEPVMAGVKDVPNDQGAQVKVSWDASPLDTDILFRNISDYIVYRSVSTRLAAQLARAGVSDEAGATLNGRHYVRTQSAAATVYWEELAHVTPHHLPSYSYLAATEGDSTGGSNPRTSFMIMALGYYNSYWWISKADSGYSVDNIPPLAPAPLTGQYAPSGTALHWNPNTEPDVAGYRVYRGSSPAFVPGPASLLATVADTGYVASGSAPYYYKLTAIDVHGNESPVATLMPSGTLGVGDVSMLHADFAAPAPNPLRSGRGTTLRFTLASAGRAKLSLYDAQGRMVRTLADGAREAGEHAIAFDGRDASGRALSPGLYLARLSAPGLSVTRRMVITE